MGAVDEVFKIDGVIPVTAESIAELAAEIRALRWQIRDAEIGLNTWDTGRNSEYWLRYPVSKEGFAGLPERLQPKGGRGV